MIRQRTWYETRVANGAIAAGEALMLNANGTVSTLTAGNRFFGVARNAIANANTGLIVVRGRVRAIADNAIANGENLTSTALAVPGRVRAGGAAAALVSSSVGGGGGHVHPSAGGNAVTSTVGGTIDAHTLVVGEMPAHTHTTDKQVLGFALALSAAANPGDPFDMFIY